MAKGLVFVTWLGSGTPSEMSIHGELRVQGASDPIAWSATAGWNSNAQAINTAIESAAIAAGQDAGFNIGTNDIVTLAAAKTL